MADLWYYGRGAELFGPYSGWQVAELADAGMVLRTDTVWEDANEDGVPADTIPHLFPAAAAVAGPGAVICGQDGTTVRYTMKCTTCGKEDRCTSTATTVRGPCGSASSAPSAGSDGRSRSTGGERSKTTPAGENKSRYWNPSRTGTG